MPRKTCLQNDLKCVEQDEKTLLIFSLTVFVVVEVVHLSYCCYWATDLLKDVS